MNWKIPFSDIDVGEEEIRAIVSTLKSKWLTMGPKTERFEEAFRNLLNSPYAIAVSSGTAGLHIAYTLLNLTPRDEIIVPALTFVATASTVLLAGAKPVFADIISEDDLTISPDDIKKKITDHTKAICVVHYGGYACEMAEILSIAKEHNLTVIEDASHSPYATFKNKTLGTIGDIGIFSLYSNKNLTTGEGGMITTDSEAFANRARLLRSHCITSTTMERHKGHHPPIYDVIDLGFNYRIDEIRAALGLVQLKKLKENNKRRREIVRLYQKYLTNVDEIGLPFLNFNRGIPSYHLMPIILRKGDRFEFIKKMGEKGIQLSVHYRPVHLFSYYQSIGYKKGSLPITEWVGEREISLPLYPEMSGNDVKFVTNAIKDVLFSMS